jgi:hypothetical protein
MAFDFGPSVGLSAYTTCRMARGKSERSDETIIEGKIGGID